VGTLFLVGTPIGNLEDITQRALRVLEEVDLIAAEDTRRSKKLLQHYAITTPMISYHEHNKILRSDRLLEALESGSVALISDAGMPGLSDPGLELIRAVIDAGHPVVPIPGPSAGVAALVTSGLPTDAYVYHGYMPRKKSERRDLIRTLREESRTTIFFEAPHRMQSMLEDLIEILNEDRLIVVCRELTKLYEETLRGTIKEVQEHFQNHEPKGEFTIVLGGVPSQDRWGEKEVLERLREKLNQGISPSQAARQVASESGWTRRAVYRLTMEE
jgi:16S rRNA (cytidine1402-2'-O)-methyltransferase